ncbi:H-NS histone [Pseudomonas chlororaphis]|uniref:histone-like nucleoid-structuring protein, MvaT/MvaU family n=1 Tax=Pseudomonas chlororaphis TaxID=587753 RepID=UPI000789F256|nr:histone-like nucleoid-structuring protein, MvaT/MvaU family [Pseudomonas chlororaphis]AMS13129.1 H-NS histone [Pseudomonas chlororaphis]
MSLITEYRATENTIKQLQKKLEVLADDPALLTEMEFEERLRALMGEYSKSLRDIIKLLDPDRATLTFDIPSTRKRRAVKVYRHPDSGEVVETKGGNHRLLKAWKQQYGVETVESWLDR